MSKKILVVSQRFWPENNQINDICEGFIERGYSVDVLCGQPNYPGGEFYKGYSSFKPGREEHRKMNIYRTMEIKKSNYSSIRMFLNYVTFPIASMFKKAALRKNDYDRIFIYQQSPVMMSLAGLSIGRSRRILTTMFVQDVWPERLYDEMEVKSYVFNKFLPRLSAWHYRRANRLIVTSEAAKSYLIREMNIPAGSIRCVPQFPYRVMEKDMRSEELMERYAGSFNIMFIGDVTNEYSFDTILEAAQRIDRHAIRDIRFIIVGDGLNLKDLKARVNRLKLHDYFFYEENVPASRLGRYASIADVLIACTPMDRANSLVQYHLVANYMAAGKPLVLAMGTGPKRMIRAAGCGLASEPDDADGLYENIMRMYRTPKAELREMGRKGRKYQREHFGRDNCIDQILDVIYDEKL